MSNNNLDSKTAPKQSTVPKDNSAISEEDIMQIIEFKLGEEEFGVDIFAVKEIIRMPSMTRVPNSPEFVVGVINMRGKVIPIIDLCIRFGLPLTKNNQHERKIIVIEHENKIVGFLVDVVHEVAKISKSVAEPPPPIVSGIESDYITAIAKLEDKLLILLEIAKILVLAEEHKYTFQVN